MCYPTHNIKLNSSCPAALHSDFPSSHCAEKVNQTLSPATSPWCLTKLTTMDPQLCLLISLALQMIAIFKIMAQWNLKKFEQNLEQNS